MLCQSLLNLQSFVWNYLFSSALQLEVQFEYDASFYGRDNILTQVNFAFILFYIIEQVKEWIRTSSLDHLLSRPVATLVWPLAFKASRQPSLTVGFPGKRQS